VNPAAAQCRASGRVQKWEIGQKRSTGTALKLLHFIQKKGLDIVA
jgi:putative transcriptional regulator